MPKRKRRKPSRPKAPITDATRAADEVLRDELRRFDIKKFDKGLAKALKP